MRKSGCPPEHRRPRDRMHIEFKEEFFTMSVQVENLEKNMAKLTVEVAAEEFEKAVQAAYMKNKNKSRDSVKEKHPV